MSRKQYYDVIIIGAGISGLAAADFLSAKGKQVLVLEARDRVGGRLHTDHQLGVPVDLGGSWLHDLANNKLASNDVFNLDKFPFDSVLTQPEHHVVYDATYQRMSVAQLKEVNHYVEAFFQLLDNQPDWCCVATLLDKFEYAALPSEIASVAKQWLKYVLPCWSGAELADTSIRLWTSLSDNSANALVKNGFDRLVNQLAKNFPIYLNHPVSHINYQKVPIAVTCQAATFYCQQVIVTLPIGVLKKGDCQFYPELPLKKREAIRGIGSGLLNKVVMKFPYCFWDEMALGLYCLATDNSPMPMSVNYQAIMGEPILVNLYGGDTALKLEEMSIADRKQFALAPLKQIYGNRFVEPIEMIATHWQQDCYARGAYAYLANGLTSQCFNVLAQPVGDRLFFAGEATHSKDYATVHGAYETGIRAATQIVIER